jgi:hypothetical protein
MRPDGVCKMVEIDSLSVCVGLSDCAEYVITSEVIQKTVDIHKQAVTVAENTYPYSAHVRLPVYMAICWRQWRVVVSLNYVSQLSVYK